jgi:hypothetical protein
MYVESRQDQEQKNGAVVRRLVGYSKLSGLAATEALSQLYASARLYINFNGYDLI